MKKTNLLYTILAIVFTYNVNAQIVYTDINPDVTTTLGAGGVSSVYTVVSIDFNSDGTEEYNFRWDDYGTGWFMHMTYANGNVFNLKGTATNPYGGRYIDPMNLGDAINSSSNWGTSIPEPFIGDNSDPNFKGLGDKYVGVKFLLNGDTYYGWVLVSFDNNKTLTVKSYAYETTPNTPINAGDTGSTTEIDDMRNSEYFTIYPNPAKNTISIDTKSEQNISKIEIVDLLGKKVKEIKVSNSGCQIINISELNKGVYLISIFENDKKIGLKKLIVD